MVYEDLIPADYLLRKLAAGDTNNRIAVRRKRVETRPDAYPLTEER